MPCALLLLLAGNSLVVLLVLQPLRHAPAAALALCALARARGSAALQLLQLAAQLLAIGICLQRQPLVLLRGERQVAGR